MIPRNPWPLWLARSALALLGLLLIGWWTAQWLLVFLLGALAALAWNFHNLRRLERWLRLTRKLDPPRSLGLWGEIFDGLYRMRRRSRERDKRRRNLVRNYRDSIRAMPDATVVLRGDYAIEWCNQAALDLLGLQWPRDEGRRITNIVRHPEFVSFLAQHVHEAHSLSLPSPADARIWLEIRLIPYARKRYLLLARDTTAMKRLETMRSDFVANVSHELRTPLSVVYGVAETLDEEVGGNPELGRSVRLLQEQAERMKHLVDDLLLLARLETGGAPRNGRWVDVPALLPGLIDEARVLSGARQHQLELEATPGLLLLGNEKELRSAFANLLFNAVHYTPEGGRISLRWSSDNQAGYLEVEDTGIGIELRHIDRLTERFYRVDNGRSKSRGGTGLGLAIVKHVLMRHEAQLRIRSTPGQGSRFTCVFPAKLLRQSLAEREHAGAGP
ncbi:Phosphate regulon sensor protein PhoR (SphS) [Thioalkalivibrio nitratireducens DSM 14787]|uniref:Phosphate regulon sensor protein PhoR n=1 Tax=Thioalkalivibrio nitratireducens (strain DSM 14787 / UNIQEM 213 / ALEN2) TaxID=1255043 RepID=L0DU97_THIND|nr:phosphate regulon sensor histidine kinase PhoR [Thioalkalivibrio nitratireducens]AGA32582.1 Phosphate regulon sensor protein PhoR (SphS) [Thioalkalivibrio nitratireducens DSM 14787]